MTDNKPKTYESAGANDTDFTIAFLNATISKEKGVEVPNHDIRAEEISSVGLIKGVKIKVEDRGIEH